jgi:hypothetical protein
MAASDHDINLMSASFHGAADFSNPFRKWRQARGKSSRNGGNANTASLKGMQRGLNERVINANGAHLDAELFHFESLCEILLNGLPCLCAQSSHTLIGVIAR